MSLPVCLHWDVGINLDESLSLTQDSLLVFIKRGRNRRLSNAADFVELVVGCVWGDVVAGQRRRGVLGFFEEEEHDDGEGSHKDGAEPETPAPAHGDGDVATHNGSEIVLDLC